MVFLFRRSPLPDSRAFQVFRLPKVSLGVERPPPLPGRGWGGRSAPWRSWIFQHKHRPPSPTPPPSRCPAPSRAEVLPLGPCPAFRQSRSPQRRCRRGRRMRVAEFRVQRTGSSPDPYLTNSYSIWITRLSKVGPASILVQHQFSHTLFRPHALPFRSRPRLCLKASHFPCSFPHPIASHCSSHPL